MSLRWLIISAVVISGFLPNQTLAVVDTDNDGLADDLEASHYATDPQLADTDGDGYSDGEEVALGYSPRFVKQRLIEVDSDLDGLNDDWEFRLGTAILNPDTDGDGFLDGEEVINGYSPTSRDGIKVPKRITVTLADQRLRYWFGDVELDSFLISSGLRSMPTPTGEFMIQEKIPVKRYLGPGYDLPNTKWNLHFATGRLGRYYIHGAYWHNNFGRPMSHGCVNVAYANMERLYNWAGVGTSVTIK